MWVFPLVVEPPPTSRFVVSGKRAVTPTPGAPYTLALRNAVRDGPSRAPWYALPALSVFVNNLMVGKPRMP